MKRKIMVCSVVSLMWAILTLVCEAQEPMDALRGPIDRVISILKDPQYQDPSKQALERERLWEAMHDLFNFTDMAKRTLARNWKRFSPPERKSFVTVFREFLGNNYLDKIQKGYKNEKVVYLEQQMLSPDKALVKTKIIREDIEIPVHYRMKMYRGGWRAYDVNIEGVSLVKNYRTQFNKLLMKGSPAELIERLKRKIEKQKKQRETAGHACHARKDLLPC
ncbi:MAG: ABC transporter substrate-binding protein [Deltaproteobacteria bacterium]|nr:ABC transporter substrate-binding protein [Deltaproteobacteria bacterium]